MNHNFRLIFSRSLARWVVASEHASRCGKAATRSTSSARRRLAPVSTLLVAALGAGEVAAACKKPWESVDDSMLIPGIRQMARTPGAAYRIDWWGDGKSVERGRDAAKMPSAWLDHYCEQSPATPAGQNLIVYSQANNGGGGNGGGVIGSGGRGGRGGDGSDIFLGILSDTGLISLTANNTPALRAHSVGGRGGDGGHGGTISGSGGEGGLGGNGGAIAMLNVGTLKTAGSGSSAMFAISEGGFGGLGGGGSWAPWDSGGHGGAGGNSGAVVNMTNAGTIETRGNASDGMHGLSVGGNGGGGGVRIGTFGVAVGGDGGGGGIGGSVTLHNKSGSSVITRGGQADALSAQSIGGGGGDGGWAIATNAVASFAIGGDAGSGGAGGQTTVRNAGSLATSGTDAIGIRAQSIGGGGGSGGRSIAVAAGVNVSFAAAIGGRGGSGGNGALVNVENTSGSIVTGADLYERLKSASTIEQLDPLAWVATNPTLLSERAYGIFAQSLGGGGGSGGSVITASAAVGASAALASSFALGGSGGSGGSGGAVSVGNAGTVSTYGAFSQAIMAQSVGGGGGVGGDILSIAAGVTPGSASGTLSVNLGGKGGSGGNGQKVELETGAQLSTWGLQADAVLAQSIGGGGGNAGSILNVGATVGSSAFTLGVNLGRSGGDGGSGGAVVVNPSITAASAKTRITTLGDGASGIVAQSVGGGGGKGGTVKNYALALQKGDGTAGTVNVSLGGSGGSGGRGDLVTVNYNGTMETFGSHAQGILAQSIGGGGGAGGHVFALSAALSLNRNVAGSSAGRALNASVVLGGAGGSGNQSSAVRVTLDGETRITTAGTRSPGVLAQSVGGGGGQGGNTHSFSMVSSLPSMLAIKETTIAKILGTLVPTLKKQAQDGKGQTSLNLSAAVGGKGGAGAVGGQVTVNVAGAITTGGNQSYGLFAQSIGGGGGSAGSALTTGLEGVGSNSVSLAIGGAGGSGGNASGVAVALAGSAAAITTGGEAAHGMLVQSIGGGGGEGGMATAALDDYTFMSSFSASLALGGSGGAAGNGAGVQLVNEGAVKTTGANASGIVAQSIGGGGGVGAATGVPTAQLNSSLGGSGGGGGNGSSVAVAAGSVTTTGQNAIGILAQSIGGGGGLAGVGTTGGGLAHLSLGVGGTGGSAGNGGSVNVGCLGAFTTIAGCARSITTSGTVAHGIMAQSVGGGGGLTQSSHLGLSNVSTTTQQIDLGTNGFWRGSADNGGTGKVAVADSAAARFAIRTSGKGAIGIVAQALSGGGGALSLDQDSSRYTVKYTNGIQTNGGSAGTNGGVELKLNGSITTTGTAAHGIYAQALAGAHTLLGADNAQVFGGRYVANGRIDITTTANANISTSGASAHGLVSMSNVAGSSPAQVLSLSGLIKATGANAWAVKASNGFADSTRTALDSSLSVDVRGKVEGGAGSAGALSLENYNGGPNRLMLYSGASVSMERSNAAADCPAAGCVVVAMTSNLRNELTILEGASLSGGMARLTTPDSGGAGSGQFVGIQGTLRGLPVADGSGQLNVYNVPALVIRGNQSQILVDPTGQWFGGLDSTAGGRMINSGTVTGNIAAPRLSYYNNGRHVLQVPGSGGGSVALNVAQLDSSKGQLVVELSSLPSSTFKAKELVSASSSLQLGSGIKSAGAATRLDLVQSGNKVSLTGARVDYGVRSMPPGLEAAVTIANDQANLQTVPEDGVEPQFSHLYDLLLDMANEPDVARMENALQNFALGYADAELALAAAWYAANHLQSCGDAKLARISAIEQGDCSWTKLTYDDMKLADGVQNGHAWGFNAGAQRQVSEHWYAGLSGGYARTAYVNTGISQSEGDRAVLGGILKYVNGRVFGAASLVGAYSWADGERLITVPGAEALAKSDRSAWLFNARLRAGYDFAFDGGYSITPALELNLPVIRDDGYRETGGGEFNMDVGASTNVVPDIHPAVQVSRHFPVGEAGVRAWVELGHRMRFNDPDVNVRMPDGFAPAEVTTTVHAMGRHSTVWGAGLLVDWTDRLEMRLVYEAERGNRFESRSGSVKFAWKL